MQLIRTLFASLYITVCLLFFVSTHAEENAGIDILGDCGDFSTHQYKPISAARISKRGAWVVTEGVVTLDKSKDYGGFWLQEAGSQVSHHRSSHMSAGGLSTGIFVYHNRATVERGQRVRLLAQVADYHGLTELKKVTALTVCNSSQGLLQRHALPAPKVLTLPIASFAALEALEGMRVRTSQSLIVSDLFGAGYGLGNYGQFAISSRLHLQPTELSLVKNRSANKSLDYLLVDDGHTARSPKFIPFPNRQGFSAHNPLRIGDRVEPLTAILHRYDEFFILVPESLDDIRIKTHPRVTKAQVAADANLVVASMNVENYFNGHPQSFNNRDVGFPTSRGAKTYSQFVLQTKKLVAALSAMDADVIALMELENDGYGEHSAIADLTRALNKQFNIEKQYRYIRPQNEQSLGQGDISVGLLYRYHYVSPKGPVSILDSRSSITSFDKALGGYGDALFNDAYHRPSLLQQFDSKKTTAQQAFYIAVNHFKSKGRPCREKKDDLQGHCYMERNKAALALTKFIEQKVSDGEAAHEMPVLIVGDLNSYSQEEPLQILKQAGYSNLNKHPSAKALFFSYSFQGYLGNLDHALANKAMLPFIRSIDSWPINSVEDYLLKYDSSYAVPDAYRSSDHDPLVIGIKF